MLKPYQRLLQRAQIFAGRFTRGMTLGVRGMLLTDDTIVLVKHSYIPGWYMPGGGVEAGESVADALDREVREETGATLVAPPTLFGVYRNAHADRRDHVVLYVCRDFDRPVPFRPNGEIVACEAFPFDCLPDGTSTGTRARLNEVLAGAAPSVDW